MKAELVLPEELFEIIKDGLFIEQMKPLYSQVILPLEALLEGDFFNQYIKKGTREDLALELASWFPNCQTSSTWSN